jgi:hypothetical protein
MDHFIRSLKVFWRSERLIGKNELQLLTKKTLLNALAGLVGLFGLVMLSLSIFFSLVPYIGNALAALTVAGTDVVLAGILLVYSGSLKPTSEVAMVKEMRDIAMSDMENELKKAEGELVALRNDARKVIRNPLDALMPIVISPLLGAVAKGLQSSSKKKDKPAAT